MRQNPGETKEETNASELERRLKYIENLSHYEMVVLWRFAKSGHWLFEEGSPEATVFSRRFEKFGGITPELSKKVGYELGPSQKSILKKTEALWLPTVGWECIKEER